MNGLNDVPGCLKRSERCEDGPLALILELLRAQVHKYLVSDGLSCLFASIVMLFLSAVLESDFLIVDRGEGRLAENSRGAVTRSSLA